MNGQASIERIELYSTHDFQAEGFYCDFEMLVCSTGVPALSTSFEANYGGNTPGTVLSLDTLAIDWTASTPGWNGFDFDRPYVYQGTGNLLFEFRYMGSSGTTVNAGAVSLPSADRCLDGGYPSCPVGETMSFLTSMRIHYTPAGTGHSGPPSLSIAPVSSPCGPSTVLSIQLPAGGPVTLSLLDLSGRTVMTVLDGAFMHSGSHHVPADLSGQPSGMYLALLRIHGSDAYCSLVRI